jgi:hypothetical protein
MRNDRHLARWPVDGVGEKKTFGSFFEKLIC